MKTAFYRPGDRRAYRTLDASSVVELFHPDAIAGLPCSLAEATVGPGEATIAHLHRGTTEIYYVLEGSATMEVAGRQEPLAAGEAVLIPADSPHHLTAGFEGCRFLCFCSPAYRHDRTRLLDGEGTAEGDGLTKKEGI